MPFIEPADYNFKIRAEIARFLDKSEERTKMKTAEDTAIATVRMYIGGRFDCDALFAAIGTDRNMFIVDIVITIALYKLYHQVGTKDMPQHRVDEYQEAIDWLKLAGKGEIDVSDVPPIDPTTNEDYTGDFMLQSKPPANHRY